MCQDPETIRQGLSALGISIGPYLDADLKEARSQIAYIAHLLELHARGINDARGLLRQIAMHDSPAPDGEAVYFNLLTEAMGVHFVSRLGASILAVETRQHKILSPHRRRPDASCDLKAKMDGTDRYFETKDFSVDEHRSLAGTRGFTPATNLSKRDWIERMIKRAQVKGANYLLARISTWQRVGRPVQPEDPIKETLVHYTSLSRNRVRIQLKTKPAQWFCGAFLIKRAGYVFVECS